MGMNSFETGSFLPDLPNCGPAMIGGGKGDVATGRGGLVAAGTESPSGPDLGAKMGDFRTVTILTVTLELIVEELCMAGVGLDGRTRICLPLAKAGSRLGAEYTLR